MASGGRKPSSVSRRRFLRRAAAAGAGAVAFDRLGGPAGATSDQPAPAGEAARTDTVPSGRFTTFSTDVLIIGAGAAGVEAAIAAAAAGADVIIVDKKRFGRCGDSGHISGGFMTSSWMGLDGDSPERQLEDAVASGEGLVDQELGLAVLQAYADDQVMLKSENYGNLHHRNPATGEPLITRAGSARRQWNGYKLFNHAYEALRLGCKVLDYCMTTTLLAAEDGAVAGATVLDFHTGEFFVIRAKATIMATGGDCQLFGAGTIVARHGGGCYGLTGDGHAMAARLGVEFRDLEFRSMYTRGGPVYPTAIGNFLNFGTHSTVGPDGYTDRHGAKLMGDVPRSELTLRRVVYEVEKMLAEGRGGPHGGYFAPVEYESHLKQWGFFMDDWRALQRIWEQNGLDLSRIEQHFVHTYDFGGIVTNARGEAGPRGLYAAGECAMHAGGGYGVFRMFSSCLVTGRWSGRNAAERARTLEIPPVDWARVDEEYRRTTAMLERTPPNPLRVHSVRHHVQDAAWLGAGAWRSERKCRAALAALDRIERDELPRMAVADKSRVCNIEWFEALETVNMIVMARLDTLAALTRTESRGTHLRNEFPDADDDRWLQNVYLKQVDGTITATTKPVVATKFQPARGRRPQGGGTLPEE